MPRRRKQLPQCSYVDTIGVRCTGPGLGLPPFCRRHFENILDDVEDAAESRDIQGILVGLLDHPAVSDLLESVGTIIDRAARRPTARPGEGYHAEWPPPPVGADWARQGAPGGRPPPPPPRQPPPANDPRVILGFKPGQALTRALVKKRRNELAALFHPDRGGSDESMQMVNAAADALLSQLP